MPKLNKPKVNNSKVNNSKLDDRPDQSKSLPSQSELPPIQLDETIVAGRRPKPLNDFQRLLAEVPELRAGFDRKMFAHLHENLPFSLKQFESKIKKIFMEMGEHFSIEPRSQFWYFRQQALEVV